MPFDTRNPRLYLASRSPRRRELLTQMGIQFDTLFTDDLYLRISAHAIETAAVLRQAFKDKGYRFYLETPSNQIFIILENQKMEELAKEVAFSFWEKYDDNHTVVRFATSWATRMEDVEALIKIL